MAVNNAGIGGARKSIAEYPLDNWHQVMGVNLNGVFYCMKYEIAAMLARGGGAIVNMSSILGSVGLPSAAAYTAAKHGVVGLTKVAAMEYGRMGIRINAVGPGWIDTPFLSDHLEEASKLMAGASADWQAWETGRGRSSGVLPAIGTGQLYHRQLPSCRRRLYRALGAWARWHHPCGEVSNGSIVPVVRGARLALTLGNATIGATLPKSGARHSLNNNCGEKPCRRMLASALHSQSWP